MLRSFVLAALVHCLLNSAGLAQDLGEDAGRRMLDDLRLRAERLHDFQAAGRWTLTGPSNRPDSREISFAAIVMDDGTVSSLTTFLAPADIAGTRILDRAPTGRPAERWAYLPDLGQVVAIGAESRSGSPFAIPVPVGIGIGWKKEARADWVGLLPCASDRRCQVFDLRSADADGGEGTRIWLDAELDVVIRIEKMAPGGRKISSIDFREYRTLTGDIRIAHFVRIGNLLSGEISVFEWRNIKINAGLSADRFTPSALAPPP